MYSLSFEIVVPCFLKNNVICEWKRLAYHYGCNFSYDAYGIISTPWISQRDHISEKHINDVKNAYEQTEKWVNGNDCESSRDKCCSIIQCSLPGNLKYYVQYLRHSLSGIGVTYTYKIFKFGFCSVVKFDVIVPTNKRWLFDFTVNTFKKDRKCILKKAK